jgi:hypothetical protein
MKHRPTETPFLMKRGGVFCDSYALKRVAIEVIGMLSVLKGAMDRRSLRVAMGLKAEKNFRLVHLRPALNAGLIEMTIPNMPRSSKQEYRFIDKGRQVSTQSEKRELK